MTESWESVTEAVFVNISAASIYYLSLLGKYKEGDTNMFLRGRGFLYNFPSFAVVSYKLGNGIEVD